MQPPKWFSELLEWIVALPPDFAFLLALPFLVAAAALIQDVICRSCKCQGNIDPHTDL